MVRRSLLGFVTVCHGKIGLARCGAVSLVKARQVRLGLARRGVVCLGSSRQVWLGEARIGLVRQVPVSHGRLGMVCSGGVC